MRRRRALKAAYYHGKVISAFTTGSLSQVKILVIGAGVAGLQAIVTAKKLGSTVIAMDTRPAVAEQAKKLGAEFVSLSGLQDDQETIQKYLKEVDVVIASAHIPGKRAALSSSTMARSGRSKTTSCTISEKLRPPWRQNWPASATSRLQGCISKRKNETGNPPPWDLMVCALTGFGYHWRPYIFEFPTRRRPNFPQLRPPRGDTSTAASALLHKYLRRLRK